MPAIHISPPPLLALTLTLAAAACSNGTSIRATPTPTPTICTAALEPLLYTVDSPVPQATNVPTSPGTIVYAAESPLKLVLFAGNPSSEPANGSGVATTPTAVPSPLPSPFAAENNGFTYYAVSYPTLLPATTYAIGTLVTAASEICGGTPTDVTSNYDLASSFSTQ